MHRAKPRPERGRGAPRCGAAEGAMRGAGRARTEGAIPPAPVVGSGCGAAVAARPGGAPGIDLDTGGLPGASVSRPAASSSGGGADGRCGNRGGRWRPAHPDRISAPGRYGNRTHAEREAPGASRRGAARRTSRADRRGRDRRTAVASPGACRARRRGRACPGSAAAAGKDRAVARRSRFARAPGPRGPARTAPRPGRRAHCAGGRRRDLRPDLRRLSRRAPPGLSGYRRTDSGAPDRASGISARRQAVCGTGRRALAPLIIRGECPAPFRRAFRDRGLAESRRDAAKRGAWNAGETSAPRGARRPWRFNPGSREP